MAEIVFPHTLTNGTEADASQVMDDLNAILAQVNGELDATYNVKPGEFLELFTKGTQRRVAFGAAGSGGFGGGPMITGLIAHGIGLTPVIALITAGDIAVFGGAGGTMPVVASVTALDSTNISWRARIADGQNSNNGVNLYWLAVG